MKHPDRLVNNESPFETGNRASYLRYDSLEEVLRGQSAGLVDQAIKDGEKKRIMIESLGNEAARKIEKAARKIEEAAEIVSRMWKIFEPHMKTEDKI